MSASKGMAKATKPRGAKAANRAIREAAFRWRAALVKPRP
jgi:hypothetical protein